MLRKRDTFLERYQKFRMELRGEILSGNLKPLEFILPENALSEKYELSRVSIRKVLAELVEEGLIEKIPGKGNRIAAPKEGEAKKETIKLAWFSTSYEIEIVREIVKQYCELHPFVDVELTLIPGAGYTESLVQQIERGDGPDVFMISDEQFRQLLDLGKADLLAPYVSPKLDPEADSYPKVFEMFTYKDQTMVTPFLFSPVVICYNEDIMVHVGISHDEPIETWDDLLSVAKRCTIGSDQDGLKDTYGFCFSSSPHRWPVFMLQNEGSLATDQGVCNMDQKATIEALEFCLDLMYKHQVSPIYSHGSEHLAEALFAKERIAMILSTYYFMNEFRDHSIRWNVKPVPKQKTEGTLLLGGALGINKHSPHQKIAQSLIDFMVSHEAQTLLKKMGCTIPVLREVAEDDALLDENIHPANYNVFKEVLPYASTVLELNLSQSEIALMMGEMQLMWANIMRPAEVCRVIEDKINDNRKN